MLAYYLRLAVISIRSNAAMSALMVCAVALGIGTCMTFVTVHYIMARDPIPRKSDVLHAVQLDTWGSIEPANDDGTPPAQLTYMDAVALMDAKPAFRQAAMTGTVFVVEPDGNGRPFSATGRAAGANFFAMFEVPFQYGQSWDARADADLDQVAVLSQPLNERLFGGENSVGRSVSLGGNRFRVVGVLDAWRPIPKFYDVNTGPFNAPADIFVPFSLMAALELPRNGSTNCWKPREAGHAGFLASECVWIQFWAELRNDAEKRAYRTFLDNYAKEQKALGRFERPLNNRLLDVNAWLDYRRVVDDNAKMMLAVGAMFLAVCLLNTIGLLLAKFLGKAPEIGLRRALGASKRTLFAQYLVESAGIGVCGGVGGIVLTWFGLRGVEALLGDLVTNLVDLDAPMVTLGVVLAIASSMAAGLYPTWRACNVEPAAQLKTQ